MSLPTHAAPTEIQRVGAHPVPMPGFGPIGRRLEPAIGAAAKQGVLTPAFVLKAVQRRWKLVLAAVIVLTTIGAAIVVLTFQRQYRASALLVIRDVAPRVLAGAGADRESNRFAQTEIQIITSSIVMGSVCSNPAIIAIPEISAQASRAEWLGKAVKVASVNNSELYSVEYVGPDPNNAQAIVKEVVYVYLQQQFVESRDEKQRVLGLLKQAKQNRTLQVESLQKGVLDLARRLTGRDPFGNDSPTDLERALTTRVTPLKQRLIEVEVERDVLQWSIDAMKAAPPPAEQAPPTEIAASKIESHPDVSAITQGISFLEANLEETKKRAKKPGSEFVKKLEEELVEAKSHLTKRREEVKAELLANTTLKESDRGEGLREKELQVRMLNAKHASLLEHYNAARKDRTDQSGDSVNLEAQQAMLARAEEHLSAINQRIFHLETEENAPARVVERGSVGVPLTPIENWPYKLLGLTILVGIALPAGASVAWELYARRLADSDQLSRDAELTVIGEISRLPSRPVHLRGAAPARLEREVAAFHESVDSLRTYLLLGEDSRDLRTLAVTSAVGGEGKTSLTYQLAMSIADATGQRVLVVDGDMRSPSLHRLFEVGLEPGLAQVLSGTCEPIDAVVEGVSGVDIMPAGRLSTTPHKIISGEALTRLISAVRAKYDYVLIDTPPVLAASEALVIAAAAEGTLLCAMRDVSQSRQVRLASDRLASSGAKLLGAVFSGTPARHYASIYGGYA